MLGVVGVREDFFAVRSWDGGEVSFLLQKSDGIELTSLLSCTAALLFFVDCVGVEYCSRRLWSWIDGGVGSGDSRSYDNAHDSWRVGLYHEWYGLLQVVRSVFDARNIELVESRSSREISSLKLNYRPLLHPPWNQPSIQGTS
jgi:hypothetical protein